MELVVADVLPQKFTPEVTVSKSSLTLESPPCLFGFLQFFQPSTEILHIAYIAKLARDSSVGIATCYGLDGSGIECRRGRDFPHPSRPALRPNQLPVQWVPALLFDGKAAGA